VKSGHLVEERDILRNNWRDVRTERLRLKTILASGECTIHGIRNNPEYKSLKKKQRHISKMIKHIEYKISREMKNGAR